MKRNNERGNAIIGFLVVILVLLIGGGTLYGCPKYRVWQKGLAGEALLREAVSTRQVAVEEAKARLESAEFDKQSEVLRAHGVAEANAIIGDSLRDNEGYLRYLWVLGLQDENAETIYVATEANLPLLEATRGIR